MPATVETSALNPFPWYRQMRADQPVYYHEAYNTWQVFRYDDVLRVLSDSCRVFVQFQRGERAAIR